MPEEKVLTESGYTKLIFDIRKIIEQGKERASLAAGHELARTYWEVGERISKEGLLERGGYAASLLEDLAEELGMDRTTLLRALYFFQTYSKFPEDSALTWSHYKYLLPLNDPVERKWYENLIVEEGLGIRQLSNAIKEDFYKEKGKRKKAKRGVIKRPKEATYVYACKVKRVIDGDTILIGIDLGFTVWKEQRIRLAGIDSPAMDEPKGRDAYKFVRDEMAKAAVVMVKTNKIDIYGRYVGHIFYSFKNEDKDKVFSQGKYLSQELLSKGLAKII